MKRNMPIIWLILNKEGAHEIELSIGCGALIEFAYRFRWIYYLFLSLFTSRHAKQHQIEKISVWQSHLMCILMHNFLMAARKKILWICFFSVCLFAARRSQGEPSTVTTHSFVFFPSNHSCHFECRLQCEWLIFFAACLCVVHTQFSD